MLPLKLAGILPQLACLLGNRLTGASSRLLPPIDLLIELYMSGGWLSLRSTNGRCGHCELLVELYMSGGWLGLRSTNGRCDHCDLLIELHMSGGWLSLRSTNGRCGHWVVPRLGVDAALLLLVISGINVRYFLSVLVDMKS